MPTSAHTTAHLLVPLPSSLPLLPCPFDPLFSFSLGALPSLDVGSFSSSLWLNQHGQGSFMLLWGIIRALWASKTSSFSDKY